MTILSLAKPRLDFGAHREPVTTQFVPIHQLTPPGLRSTWLHRSGDRAIIEGLAPRKAILLLHPDGTTSELPFPAASLKRSVLGPLTLTSLDQVVYQWEPGQPPRAVYSATSDGTHSAYSLGGERILVNRFVGKDDHGSVAVSLAAPAEPLWTLSPHRFYGDVVPHGILSTRCDENGGNAELDCHDPVTGALRWTCAWALCTTIAIVDDVLWASGRDCLQRVDVRNGTRLPDVAVREASTPKGLVDERGVFHCSHGFNYQTLDLRDDGRVLAFARFEATVAGPKLGAGALSMALADDGRMVFGDEGGGVWVVHPDRPTKPELVWRAAGPIFAIVVQHGALWLDVHGHGYVLLG